jgi:hypothetical protein
MPHQNKWLQSLCKGIGLLLFSAENVLQQKYSIAIVELLAIVETLNEFEVML